MSTAGPLLARLTVSDRSGTRRLYSISDGRRLQIGRESSNDIILDDPNVSRIHASLEATATQLVIADLFSRNGTFVNGERISEDRVLRDGDVIHIGSFSLTVHITEGRKGSRAHPDTITGGLHQVALSAAAWWGSVVDEKALDNLGGLIRAGGGKIADRRSNWLLSVWLKPIEEWAPNLLRCAEEILSSESLESAHLHCYVCSVPALFYGKEVQWEGGMLLEDGSRAAFEMAAIVRNLPHRLLLEDRVSTHLPKSLAREIITSFKKKGESKSRSIYRVV